VTGLTLIKFRPVSSGGATLNRLKQLVISLLVAVQFLTTIPVFFWRQSTSEDVGRSVRYFPVVGLLLGAMLVILYWLLSFFLTPVIIGLALVIFLLMITGALHFDGFLDCCDGLFGFRGAERRLEIMRDSRVGSFAVAGGWALLTLKYITLLQIPANLVTPALLLAPLFGRWALVIAVVLFPYGRESGLGTIYKQYTKKLELFLAGLVVLVVAGLVLRLAGLVLVVVMFGLAWLVGRWMMSKIPKGLTGDCYGAITEFCEMATWFIIASAGSLLTMFS
jgi:adenosylcobinamide-GDP ribazoletransferase